jgi:hypothetical protein
VNRGDSSSLFTGWSDYTLFSVLALLSTWLHAALHLYAFDDAYIHFRVAERFLEHGAPYYNAGEAVMASSSPAWTLVLCILFAAGGSAMAVAVFNGIVAALGAVAFIALARELSGGELGRWPCWSFGLPYLSLIHFSGIGLMETSLGISVLGLAALLYARKREEAFILLALAPFIRLELAVFFILFFLHALLRRRGGLGRRLLYSLLGGAPLAIYQLAFFKTLLPGTMHAKSIVYALSFYDVVEFILRQLMIFVPFVERWWWPAAGLALLLILGVAGEVRSRRFSGERSEILYILGSGGLLIAVVYVIARGLVFPWYVPLVAVPVTFALCVMAARSRMLVAWAALVVIIALPHAVTLAHSSLAAAGEFDRYAFFAQNARARKYLETGKRLFERFPDARLMSSEIGGLGYTFKGRIIDGVGLITPGALEHHPMRVPEQRSYGFIGAIPAGFVEEASPELIVALDIFVEELLRSEVASRYAVIREPVYIDEDLRFFPSPMVWWSRHLNIFIRKDLIVTDEK